MIEEDLKRCGASWFIVYCYYNKLDRSELRWEKAGSQKTRIYSYERIVSECNYKEVVREVLKKRLRENSFGVPVSEVFEMARKLLGE